MAAPVVNRLSALSFVTQFPGGGATVVPQVRACEFALPSACWLADGASWPLAGPVAALAGEYLMAGVDQPIEP